MLVRATLLPSMSLAAAHVGVRPRESKAAAEARYTIRIAVTVSVLQLWRSGSLPGTERGLMCTSVAAGLMCFTFIRQQTLVGDQQFLRSMIPHHSGAILMCEDANLTDDRIKPLCTAIIESQRSEIAQMRSLLDEAGAR